MILRHWVTSLVLCLLTAGSNAPISGALTCRSVQGSGFWAPRVPPAVRYIIDCRIDGSKGMLSGAERVMLTNSTSRPIRRLALDWSLSPDRTVCIMHHGRKLPILGFPEQRTQPSPILFDLPEPLEPGRQLELDLSFRHGLPSLGTQDKVKLTGWHPRIWWGMETHDDFRVKIRIPEGYALAATGRQDRDSGYYHAEKVRSFGLFLGRDHQAMEAMAGEVLVRCLYTAQGAECARLLLTTAVDVIDFYSKRFGFYPQKALTIVPGDNRPVGGYPMATGVIVVHGQERFSERAETHWRWITAHEIGHQYWLEHVLSADPGGRGWLMIGLGIYVDREYSRARDLAEKQKGLMQVYMDGVREHLDTTVERAPGQVAEVEFDWNNVVEHAKGFCIVSALANTLGQQTFDRIHSRCLEDFAGRPLGASDFQRVCEEESGESLSWFFDQWLRSNRYPSYDIAAQECKKKDDAFLSTVKVRCLGTLRMPVAVEASFEDGSKQVKLTDRLLDVNSVKFESPSPLAGVQLDPKGELPLVVPPPAATEEEWRKRIAQMEWTGVGGQALDFFLKAKEVKLSDARLWGKLGMTLYDSGYYTEALQAFERGAELTDGAAWIVVWQGHMLDLLDRREEAVRRYREALARGTGLETQHDQYGITINREWVEARLKEPFGRKQGP